MEIFVIVAGHDKEGTLELGFVAVLHGEFW
jgi:hypothetical protein